MKDAVIIISGGMDSTTMLYDMSSRMKSPWPSPLTMARPKMAASVFVP